MTCNINVIYLFVFSVLYTCFVYYLKRLFTHVWALCLFVMLLVKWGTFVPFLFLTFILFFNIYFKLQMMFYPESVSLRQHNTTNAQVTQYIYLIDTIIHITQNNATKTNKTKKKKSAHKSTPVGC
jgi:hypothetical protein